MASRPSNRNRYSGSYKFKKKTQNPMIFPVQPINSGRGAYRRRNRGININFRPILFFMAIALLIIGFGYMAFSNKALAVMVDGEAVGYIKDMNTSEEEVNALILAKLKEDVGNNIEINETITLEQVNGMFKRVSNNAEGVIAQVCQAVTYKQEATKIIVEGKDACIVANVDSAKKVLQTILDNYKPSDGTTNPEFAVQIKTEPAFVESTEVIDVETAVELLSKTKQEERIHSVVQGDTFASIAANAGMTEQELLQANPSISAETKNNLSIGQQLKVVMTVPTLAIRTFKVTTRTEAIPYETEREADDSMYEGEEEEVQEGVDGQKEISERIAYINGTPQGAASSTSKVIKEPVTRIVKYGTYEPSYDDEDEDEDYYEDDENNEE